MMDEELANIIAEVLAESAVSFFGGPGMPLEFIPVELEETPNSPPGTLAP